LAEIRVQALQRLGFRAFAEIFRVLGRWLRLGFSASQRLGFRALAEIRVQGVGRD
jgi:hypothetical protein